MIALMDGCLRRDGDHVVGTLFYEGGASCEIVELVR